MKSEAVNSEIVTRDSASRDSASRDSVTGETGTAPDGLPGRRPRALPGTVLRPVRAGLLALAVLLAGLAVAVPLAVRWSSALAEEALREQGQSRLSLYAANLRTELEKHEAIPSVLARDLEVAELLLSSERPDPALLDRLNRKLEVIARELGALAIYVMDARGDTLVSSNWNQPDSFVGRNFSFRPYFRIAMERGEGRYFLLGTTSGVPGYYTGNRVMADGRAVGTVVLKVGFHRLEETWRRAGEKLLVADRAGFGFITNVEEWRYRPPPWREEGREEFVPDRFSLRDGTGMRPHLLQSVALPGGDWTLHALTSLDAVRARARQAGLLAAALVGLVALGTYAVAQRRRAFAERLALQEEARRELERRVAETTAELREAENELTQAAKLAALGQMSAGIAHEINQPLAAIRSFADNAVVLLEREKHQSVRDNLAEIADLTDRMAGITRQLKGFARRASGTLGPVSAAQAVAGALSLLGARLRRDGILVETELPEEPVWVLAEDVRLQQVLVNLFGNAADAMRGMPERVLRIRLSTDAAGDAVLTVRDTGTGIAEADLKRLFVPFFTTKDAGDGLGLGLSISHGIVEDFGGRLTAVNAPDADAPGAVFTLYLKRAEPPR